MFVSAGANDPGCYAPTLVSGRRTMYTMVGGGYDNPVVVPDQPFGLNEFGHQGLLHEEELDNGNRIQNRHRVLHAGLGRFIQRDPLGYVDGMSLYQYVLSNPSMNQDVQGLCEQKKKSSESSGGGFWDAVKAFWRNNFSDELGNERTSKNNILEARAEALRQSGLGDEQAAQEVRKAAEENRQMMIPVTAVASGIQTGMVETAKTVVVTAATSGTLAVAGEVVGVVSQAASKGTTLARQLGQAGEEAVG